MKQREYHVGPGAVSLLLIIVVVSMSVLGLLSLISARGDYKLTERARELAVMERETAAEAEAALAHLDAILAECVLTSSADDGYIDAVQRMLPEDMQMEDRIVSWDQTGSGGRILKCSIEVLPFGSEERFVWTKHAFEAAVMDGYSSMSFDVWE